MLMSLARLPELKKSVRRVLQHLGLNGDEVAGNASDDVHAA
jgi:hypothetical protein